MLHRIKGVNQEKARQKIQETRDLTQEKGKEQPEEGSGIPGQGLAPGPDNSQQTGPAVWTETAARSTGAEGSLDLVTLQNRMLRGY